MVTDAHVPAAIVSRRTSTPFARMPRRAAARFPGMGPHYAALARRIVEGSTVVMHPRLRMPPRGGQVCVAIGASRRYAERGLLAMLRRDGYRITRRW